MRNVTQEFKKDRSLNANMAHPQEDIGQILSDYTKAYESQIRVLRDELENACSEAAILKNFIRDEVDARKRPEEKDSPKSQIQLTRSAEQNSQVGRDELVKQIRILSDQLRQQAQESEAIIFNKDQENRQLHDRVEMFRCTTIQRNKEITMLESEITQLQTENKDYRAKFTSSLAQQQKKGEGHDGQSAQYGEHPDATSSTKAERYLENRLERTERQNKELVEMFFKYQLDADKVQIRLQSLQGVLEKRPGDSKDVEKLIKAERLIASKAQDRVQELTDKNGELERVRDLHSTKIEGLTKSLEHREADVHSLKVQLYKYKEQADSFFEMMKNKIFRDDLMKSMSDHYEVMRKDNGVLADSTLMLQEEVQDLQTSLLNANLAFKVQEAEFCVLEKELVEATSGPKEKIDALYKTLLTLETDNSLLRKSNNEMKDALRWPPPGQKDLPEVKENELARLRYDLQSAKQEKEGLENSWNRLNDAYQNLADENAKDFLLYEALHPQLDEARAEIETLKEKLTQRDSPTKGFEHWKEMASLRDQVQKIQDHWINEMDKVESNMEIAKLQIDLLHDLATRLKDRMFRIEKVMTDDQRKEVLQNEDKELMIDCETVLRETSSEASITGEHPPEFPPYDSDESGTMYTDSAVYVSRTPQSSSTTHEEEAHVTYGKKGPLRVCNPDIVRDSMELLGTTY